MMDYNVWMLEYPFSHEIQKDGQEKEQIVRKIIGEIT